MVDVTISDAYLGMPSLVFSSTCIANSTPWGSREWSKWGVASRSEAAVPCLMLTSVVAARPPYGERVAAW